MNLSRAYQAIHVCVCVLSGEEYSASTRPGQKRFSVVIHSKGTLAN